VTNWRIKCL